MVAYIAKLGKAAKHSKNMLEGFKQRFMICLVATIPVLFLSPTIQSFFNFYLRFPGDILVLLGISTFVFVYGGMPFFVGLSREIKAKSPGMMTLVGIAIFIAYFYSAATVFFIPGKMFFWELVTLIDIMLLGHYIEMRSALGASKSVEKLAKIMPAKAHLLLDDGSMKSVSINQLSKNDKVVVKPGEKVPADGVVVDGESEIDEAFLTGESKPKYRNVGDKVLGGAINGDGSLTIEVKEVGKDSYLSRVIDLVNSAIFSKSKIQTLANRVALVLTVISLFTGLITFSVWFYFGNDILFALERTVTVMVIACPHALGLAIPLVISRVVTLGAGRGILIRNKKAFEDAHKVDTIIFDKTGTLTKGEMEVSDVVAFKEGQENEVLSCAAALEQKATHGIAVAIVRRAADDGLEIPKVENFKQEVGRGVVGEIENKKVVIGNKKMFEDLELGSEKSKKRLEETKTVMRRLAKKGKSVLFVACDGEIKGVIGLEDAIREEAAEACKNLKKSGYKLAIITGDNKVTASSVARKLGIDEVYADILPDQKLAKIRKLQRKGKKVAMVGDGINDAPALVQANVGIAIGSGTDVAIESADVVLVRSDLRRVADTFDLSAASKRKLVQNLVWATGYNLAALPIAGGALYGYNIMLKPSMAAILMALSTTIVAINSRFISRCRKCGKC